MDSAIEAQLRRWGMVKTYGEERRAEVAENPRQHIIERTRRFAPQTRDRAKVKLAARDGYDRRRIVASKAGIEGLSVVPMWSSDPVRCSATRKGQYARPRDVVIEMPRELEWIDRALSAMKLKAPVAALVLRIEFTHNGTQKQRAAAAQRAYGGQLTYWQYRKELERALALLEGFTLAA